jgi:hypothetical protein
VAKNVHDDVLDAALNILKSNGTRLVVLTAEPTGASAYNNAITKEQSSGYMIAIKTIASSAYTGPANGDSSGRKIAVNAASSISITGPASSASATHVGVLQYHASSGSLQKVLYTTTCTTQSLSNGNKVNTPAWDIEIRDPA